MTIEYKHLTLCWSCGKPYFVKEIEVNNTASYCTEECFLKDLSKGKIQKLD